MKLNTKSRVVLSLTTNPENKMAYEAAHFPPDFNTTRIVPPGTNGYPDVDTWRDIVFFIETR